MNSLPTQGLRSAEIVEGRLHLVLNNTLAAIEDGRRAMQEFLAEQELGARVVHRLEVLFEELVANTIRHGFVKGADHAIHISIAPGTDRIDLVFEDDGMVFNPLEAPPPEPFSSLEKARVGGLGIHLVSKLAANVAYEAVEPCVDANKPGAFVPRNRLLVSMKPD